MTPSARLRLVAAILCLVALGVLVAIRVGDSTTTPTSGSETDRTTAAGSPTTTVAGAADAEPPAADPRSTVTSRQLAGIAFTDVTAEAGLDHPHSDLALLADMSMTSGAAAADIDADGDIDLYVTRLNLANSLYRNNGDGTFTDIAAEAGVDRAVPGGFQGSGAAAFADIDADGCVDLYVTGVGAGQAPGDDSPPGARSGEAALFVNDCAGHFVDQTAARGVALPPNTNNLGAQGHGVTFADYDHDGALDLLVLHWDPAFLGGNAAMAAFSEVPEPESICERTAATRAGGADRTPAAGANRARLFHNDGTGHFTDVTAATGLGLDGIAAFTGDFVDVTGDGWEDLLIAGDFCTSHLYRNDAGRGFTDITAEAGVGTDENGMGSVVRDVDGDGDPDWFITSISLRTKSGNCATRTANTGCSGNRLYLNDGTGSFRDATDDAGVRDGWWGWGAAIEDFGDDGRLSIVQTNGYAGAEAPRDAFATDPLRFWLPTKPATATAPPKFSEGAAPAGLTDDGVGHGLVPFDYDGDGDLDVFVANFGTAPVLYRNDRPERRHWLTVRLDDRTRPGNRAGIGARIEITGGTRDADVATGWVTTGGSYESQRPAEFHVGRGRDASPVTVSVWWPGAAEPTVMADVPVDQVVTVVR